MGLRARSVREEPQVGRPSALRALVAAELAAIVVLGVLCIVRLPVWSPVDEQAHVAYVQTVAEQHRLPLLLRDVIPAPRGGLADDKLIHRYRSVGGRPINYEAFQAPLYFLVATPVYLVAPGGSGKVYALRVLGLLLLLGAIAVLWALAGRVLPEQRLLGFAFGLGVLLWPGVLLRAVTVSNSALELPLALGFLVALWDADVRRDGRRLLLAGALLGLGLLTKTTLVYLVPLLVVVAARHAWGGRSRRALAVALAALVLPLALLSPWLASNHARYGTWTANGQARDQQRADVFGSKYHYRWHDLKPELPIMLGGFEPQEWGFRTQITHPVLILPFQLLKAGLWGIPLLLLLARPRRWLRSRHAAFLLAPWLLVVLLLVASSLLTNWSILLPRYAYPTLPGLALFGAVAWRELGTEDRVGVTVAAATVGLLGFVWLYAVSDFLT